MAAQCLADLDSPMTQNRNFGMNRNIGKQGTETMSNIEKRTIEIRAGEGGADARIFVAELANAYLALAMSKD
jgi:hypothetical protein